MPSALAKDACDTLFLAIWLAKMLPKWGAVLGVLVFFVIGVALIGIKVSVFINLSKFFVYLNKYLIYLNNFLIDLNNFFDDLNKFFDDLNKFLIDLNNFLVDLNKFFIDLNNFFMYLNNNNRNKRVYFLR